MKKYSPKNSPKNKYNFTEKTSESIIANLKSGRLSEDAIEVGFYILKYERQFGEGIIKQIKSEIKKSNEKQIFNSFGLKIIEVNKTFKMKFKKTNKNLKNILLLILSLIYLLIIFPFSIQRIIEGEYLYLFGTLIFLIPFIILKAIKYFNNENKFYLEIDDKFFIVKSISTNYETFKTEKINVNELNIVENGDYELKLMAQFKNRKQIEIISELYSNFNKGNIYEYLNNVKDKIIIRLKE